MFIFNNNYMSKLSELHLRFFLWLMAGSTVTFVLLSSCMGLQVLLRVLTHNQHLTNYIQPWYELGGFICGFLITHPYMYLFRQVRWIPTAQLFFLDDELSVSRRNVWLIHWMWVFAGIVFLIFVTVVSFVKLLPTWREVDKVSNIRTPEKLDILETPPMAMRNNRQKYVRAATLRISGYFLIPIVTQLMVVVGNLLSRAPYWLFVMANIMPATQGMLNMVAFIMSPSLDSHRKAFVRGIHRIGHRRGRSSGKTGDSEMGLHYPISSTQPSSTFSTFSPRKEEYSYP
ncbi:hypothetical protein H4R20_005506 [Coemansia guatemalensis]|uniref:G protein-coupled receptor n=1 Tax=Coemansia guatemalensis TaxID=2761395 RepID=A0A9W8LS26_9FUNG|nr:hypothetical protein H4R20_005506 [Coemansia guatemalensis]